MKRPLLIPLCLAYACLGSLVLTPQLWAQEAPAASPEETKLSADEILARVRQARKLAKDQKVEGFMRKNSTKVPFGMEMKQGNICFNFSPDGQNWKTFDLKFKENGQELLGYDAQGKVQKFNPSTYSEKIADTDISFDDLSMRFLYWQQGRVLPQDRTSFIKGRKCHVLDLPNPDPSLGEYAFIRAWIDCEMGALWQIDAFDAKGTHLKRFSITSVTKTDEAWFFKQMRIELRDPQNPKKTRSVNYIELK